MDDVFSPRKKDWFLYWTLFFYPILIAGFCSDHQDYIRIPAFALLLLFLTQVIFPQFRCTKRANLIAVIILVLIPLILANPRMS